MPLSRERIERERARERERKADWRARTAPTPDYLFAAEALRWTGRAIDCLLLMVDDAEHRRAEVRVAFPAVYREAVEAAVGGLQAAVPAVGELRIEFGREYHEPAGVCGMRVWRG